MLTATAYTISRSQFTDHEPPSPWLTWIVAVFSMILLVSRSIMHPVLSRALHIHRQFPEATTYTETSTPWVGTVYTLSSFHRDHFERQHDGSRSRSKVGARPVTVSRRSTIPRQSRSTDVFGCSIDLRADGNSDVQSIAHGHTTKRLRIVFVWQFQRSFCYGRTISADQDCRIGECLAG